jgi:hypothetical protein
VRCASVQIKPTPSEIWEDFRSRPAGLKKTDHVLLEAWCMAACYDALRSMKAIYIDAGTRDEWYLDLGAEAFRRALEEIGVRDVFLELFDATRGGIEYRYPIGLRYLAERLSPPG